VPPDALVLKIHRELCHPKCTRKVSGLSRNRPLAFRARKSSRDFRETGRQQERHKFAHLAMEN